MDVLVFGSSNGESIVIKIDSWICVVDTFEYDSTSPALEYLKKKSINRISLLVITHPHADHYEGLEYFQNFNVEQFLVFNSIGSKFQKTLLELWEEGAKSQNDITSWLTNERNKFKKFISSVNYFQKKLRGNFFVASRTPNGVFYSTDIDGVALEIKILSPFSHLLEDSIDRVKNLAIKGKLSLSTICKAQDQNIFSTTLQISYGDKKILLLADVDNRNLESLIQESLDSNGYDLIKVSHHGSKNGNLKMFWEIIENQKKPCVAVITNHVYHDLPEIKIKKMIRNSVENTGGVMRIVPFDLNCPKGLLVNLIGSYPFNVSEYQN